MPIRPTSWSCQCKRESEEEKNRFGHPTPDAHGRDINRLSISYDPKVPSCARLVPRSHSTCVCFSWPFLLRLWLPPVRFIDLFPSLFRQNINTPPFVIIEPSVAIFSKQIGAKMLVDTLMAAFQVQWNHFFSGFWVNENRYLRFV